MRPIIENVIRYAPVLALTKQDAYKPGRLQLALAHLANPKTPAFVVDRYGLSELFRVNRINFISFTHHQINQMWFTVCLSPSIHICFVI